MQSVRALFWSWREDIIHQGTRHLVKTPGKKIHPAVKQFLFPARLAGQSVEGKKLRCLHMRWQCMCQVYGRNTRSVWSVKDVPIITKIERSQPDRRSNPTGTHGWVTLFCALTWQRFVFFSDSDLCWDPPPLPPAASADTPSCPSPPPAWSYTWDAVRQPGAEKIVFILCVGCVNVMTTHSQFMFPAVVQQSCVDDDGNTCIYCIYSTCSRYTGTFLGLSQGMCLLAQITWTHGGYHWTQWEHLTEKKEKKK